MGNAATGHGSAWRHALTATTAHLAHTSPHATAWTKSWTVVLRCTCSGSLKHSHPRLPHQRRAGKARGQGARARRAAVRHYRGAVDRAVELPLPGAVAEPEGVVLEVLLQGLLKRRAEGGQAGSARRRVEGRWAGAAWEGRTEVRKLRSAHSGRHAVGGTADGGRGGRAVGELSGGDDFGGDGFRRESGSAPSRAMTRCSRRRPSCCGSW